MAERTRWSALLLVLAPIALAADSSQRSEDRPRPDLSGAWSLTRELSTLAPPYSGTDGESPRPRGSDRDARGRGGSGGGMPGGGRFGGGMPSGDMPSAMASPEEMERMQRIVGELLQAQPRMIIKQERDDITFTEADGHVRTLTTNGKKQKTQLVSATVETRLKWTGDRLEQEFTLTKGRVLYRFVPISAEQFAIDVDQPSGPMASRLKIRWVYDRLR